MRVNGLFLIASMAASAGFYAFFSSCVGRSFDWRFAFASAVGTGLLNILFEGREA